LPQGGNAVGTWVTARRTATAIDIDVAIDLMVPQGVSDSPGRRSTHLPGHDPHVARKVRGLEGALVDADVLPIAALEPRDSRVFDLRVAGPAALLVAKLHKIQERRDSSRLSDKDALDILRLLRGTTTADMARRFGTIVADSRAREAARAALPWMRELFGERRGEGVRMAQRAAGGLADPAEIEASCVALTSELLRSIEG
jgi:hypothetical protein